MQLDLFDLLYEDFKFDKSKPVRLVESFAGIGTQHMAFKKLGIEVEVIAIIEVDKFALLSYAAMHTEYLEIRGGYYKDKDLSIDFMLKFLQEKNIGYDFKNDRHTITERNNIEIIRDYYLACLLTNNLGDISKVKGKDLPKGIDMFTYSFPCTDLSKAGEQKGLVGTRSGLVYEVFRIIEELKEINNKPKTLIMENVVDLIQRKFVKEFHEMQVEVENFGYMNYTFTMNAKDYGVAQNRDRVFMLSIPSHHNYAEPKPFKLVKRLKDYLEDEVNESYYLSDKQVEQINGWNSQQNPIENSKSIDDEYMQTLTAKGNTSMNASMLLIKEPTIAASRGRYESGVINQKLRIRKLTPREAFRLMGIKDEYYDRASLVNSNTQLYKQAGNAIVVDVFANILKGLI